MPRKKNEPQTQAEMIESVQKKRNSKIYKAESMEVSAEAISDTVAKALSQIRRDGHSVRFNLDDTEAVRHITMAYFETCVTENRIPSMDGVATSLGYTRANLYHYMKKRADSETGKFLIMVHDRIAEVIAENAMKGTVNNIAAIFILKALYGYRDSQTIELVQGDPMHDELSVDDICQRAGLLIDD